MPRVNASGIDGLSKRHRVGCDSKDNPTQCDCPWYAQYQGSEIQLAKWARQPVNPRDRRAAEAMLWRFRIAVDDGKFTQRTRKKLQTPKPDNPVKPPRTLGDVVDRYTAHREDAGGWADRSGHARHVASIKHWLGDVALDGLNADTITRWFRVESRTRRWSPKTWNYYHSTLSSFCRFALDRGWIASNPMVLVATKTARKPKEPERLEDNAEQRLLDACDLLDKPEERVTRATLTQTQANHIRLRVAAGEPQITIAREMNVSASTVCEIVKGRIWNPFERKRSTKGKEMRRRVLAAIRTGARAGEMLRITLPMIDFSDPECFVVTLDDTKGEKLSRQTVDVERLYVTCAELRRELLARREALKDNPPYRQYVFGREDGRRVKSFSWHPVFKLAGIPYGRNVGLVWHSLRHEAISRYAEHTPNTFEVKELARHKDVRTTERYCHARKARLKEVARRAQGGI
ncbi:MAG: tyrosine-type recombinase/integrase [Luteitalea sp.]|nr:tyrosine-type recombinase/integrase [Luteitalea sp.]